MMWREAQNRKPGPLPYEICIYCEKGYLKPVKEQFKHSRLIIIYRCSNCGEEFKRGARPANSKPVGNTEFVREPWKTQRENPFV